MGMPLLKGRYFDDRDVRGAPDVAIVDDKLAERFWPGQDPIGKRMRRGDSGPWRTVVGVVARHEGVRGGWRAADHRVLSGAEQLGIGSRVSSSSKTNAPTRGALERGRRARSQALDADLPVYDVSTMDERLARLARAAAVLDASARGVRGVRVAAGGDRDLRRRELLGQPAHARARHSRGVRRSADSTSCSS